MISSVMHPQLPMKSRTVYTRSPRRVMARPGLPIRRCPVPGAGVLRLLLLGVVLIGLPCCSEAQPGAETAASPETQVVWRAGAAGYHTYRIPVALATPGGALLAFAEGRRTGRGDAGDIDLLVKRSNDGGPDLG